MADVIERNSAKSSDGAARVGAITNAFEPGMDSVAERDRDAWEAVEAAGVRSSILYDSLEASPDAPLTVDRIDGESQADFEDRVMETVAEVVTTVRGDSVWLDVERIARSVIDRRNPASRSRRFWFNQIVARDDAWADPKAVDAAGTGDTDFTGEIVLFFDGSKSDDATALVGCRMDDGHLLTLGVWAKPAGPTGVGWTVNRYEVDEAVREILDSGQVVAFYADPGHMQDDDATGYWDSVIDGWHRDYGHEFRHWSTRFGDGAHSIMWDMSSPKRTGEFVKAAERFIDDLESGRVTHDGHPALRLHMKNAVRWPGKWGVSMRKPHRESSKKIDLAVCAVGAAMLRRVLLNRGGDRRTGKVYV